MVQKFVLFPAGTGLKGDRSAVPGRAPGAKGCEIW